MSFERALTRIRARMREIASAEAAPDKKQTKKWRQLQDAASYIEYWQVAPAEIQQLIRDVRQFPADVFAKRSMILGLLYYGCGKSFRSDLVGMFDYHSKRLKRGDPEDLKPHERYNNDAARLLWFCLKRIKSAGVVYVLTARQTMPETLRRRGEAGAGRIVFQSVEDARRYAAEHKLAADYCIWAVQGVWDADTEPSKEWWHTLKAHMPFIGEAIDLS